MGACSVALPRTWHLRELLRCPPGTDNAFLLRDGPAVSTSALSREPVGRPDSPDSTGTPSLSQVAPWRPAIFSSSPVKFAVSLCVGAVVAGRARRKGVPPSRNAGPLRRSSVRLAAVDSSSPPVQHPMDLPTLTDEEQNQLKHGLPVRKQERRGGGGWGLVVTDVDAPVETVHGVLESFEDYTGMIPTVREATMHSREKVDDGVFHVRCTYRLSRFRLRVDAVHVVDVPQRIVRFDLDPTSSGGLLREASGSWYVEPAPGGSTTSSRIWFRVRLQAANWVPQWLVDYGAQRALRRATSWLKPHVEKLQQRGRAVARGQTVSNLRASPSIALRLNPV